MPDKVTFEITITKEAVEAVFGLLTTLFPLNRESRETEEERTKEEDKERKEINPPLPLPYTNISIDKNSTITATNNNTICDGSGDSVKNNNPTNEDGIVPPTLEEVKEYVEEKSYKINPERFFYYYKGNKWSTKNGRSMIGIWKSYVDSWAQTEYNKGPVKTDPKSVEERRKARTFVPTEFE